jgi:hypothetical protein
VTSWVWTNVLNYLSKWNWSALVNSAIYESGWNVWIWTNSPENGEWWSKVLDLLWSWHAKFMVRTASITTAIYSHDGWAYWASVWWIMWTRTNHPLSFITNWATKMMIDTAWNVWIWTTWPSYKLDVAWDIRSQGNILTNSNFWKWLIWLYDSTRYQWVFSMWTSWMLPADWTTPWNLYWLSWTHSNAWWQSKAWLQHQLLVMMNGITYTALWSGIWTAWNITTSWWYITIDWWRLQVKENSAWVYSWIEMFDDESPNGKKYIHSNSNNIWFVNWAWAWISRWDEAWNQITTWDINWASLTTAWRVTWWNTSSDYLPTWWNWAYTFLLNWLNNTSIWFHDAWASVSSIRYNNGWFTIWWNDWWWTKSVDMPGWATTIAPTAANWVATKGYVDAAIASAGWWWFKVYKSDWVTVVWNFISMDNSNPMAWLTYTDSSWNIKYIPWPRYKSYSDNTTGTFYSSDCLWGSVWFQSRWMATPPSSNLIDGNLLFTRRDGYIWRYVYYSYWYAPCWWSYYRSGASCVNMWTAYCRSGEAIVRTENTNYWPAFEADPCWAWECLIK